jgi:hypothetical protein
MDQATHPIGTGSMGIHPRLVKAGLAGITLRHIPIVKRIGRWQRVAGALVMAAAVGLEACPDAIGVFAVVLLGRPIVGRIVRHAEGEHQPLESTLGRHAIEMIRIGPTLHLEERFGILPMTLMGIEEIGLHGYSPNRRFFSLAPSTSAALRTAGSDDLRKMKVSTSTSKERTSRKSAISLRI